MPIDYTPTAAHACLAEIRADAIKPGARVSHGGKAVSILEVEPAVNSRTGEAFFSIRFDNFGWRVFAPADILRVYKNGA